MLVTPENELVWVVLDILWAGVYIGATCVSLAELKLSVTFIVLPRVWENSWPRWLVLWSSPCLVVVTVLVDVGPLTATFRLPMGMPALEVISTVTAPSTLERGRTEVRRIRRRAGMLLLLLPSTVPTVSTRSPYAPLSKVLWLVLRN